MLAQSIPEVEVVWRVLSYLSLQTVYSHHSSQHTDLGVCSVFIVGIVNIVESSSLNIFLVLGNAYRVQ